MHESLCPNQLEGLKRGTVRYKHQKTWKSKLKGAIIGQKTHRRKLSIEEWAWVLPVSVEIIGGIWKMFEKGTIVIETNNGNKVRTLSITGEE